MVTCSYNYRIAVSSTSLLPWLQDHIEDVLSQSLPTRVGMSVCLYVYLCLCPCVLMYYLSVYIFVCVCLCELCVCIYVWSMSPISVTVYVTTYGSKFL